MAIEHHKLALARRLFLIQNHICLSHFLLNVLNKGGCWRLYNPGRTVRTISLRSGVLLVNRLCSESYDFRSLVDWLLIVSTFHKSMMIIADIILHQARHAMMITRCIADIWLCGLVFICGTISVLEVLWGRYLAGVWCDNLVLRRGFELEVDLIRVCRTTHKVLM